MERYQRIFKEVGGFKKIDIFYDGEYVHSTNSYKSVKDAIEGAIKSAEKIKSGFPMKGVPKHFDPKKFKGSFA
jgi:hypothetical protein